MAASKKTRLNIKKPVYFFLIAAAVALHIFLIKQFADKGPATAQAALFASGLALLAAAFAIKDFDEKKDISLEAITSLKETAVLAGFSILALFMYMFDFNSWKYSVIGDEWHFLHYAEDILSGAVRPQLFSENGIYDLPVMCSLFQAVFMKFTGAFFGWKLSSAIIAPLCLIPFYLWNKQVFNKNTAIIAASAFITSIAMLAFGHIGYANVQDVFFYVYALFFLELAISRNSSFYSFLTALTLGLGCYSFHPARLVIVICIVYFFLHPLRKKFSTVNTVITAAVFLAIAGFLLFNPGFYTNMASRTFAVQTGMVMDSVHGDKAFLYMALNFVMSLVAFAFNQDKTAYIYGGLAGLFGMIGCAAGIWLSIAGFKKDWRMKFLVISFGLLAFFLGSISPYKYPHNTRLHFMAPLLSTFIAIGFIWLAGKYMKVKAGAPAVIALSALVIMFNLISFYLVMPSKYVYSQYSYIIRAVQELPKEGKIFLSCGSYSTFDRMMVKNYYGFGGRLYPVDDPKAQLKKDEFKDSALLITADAAGAMPDTVKNFGRILKDNDKIPAVYIFDFSGEKGDYAGFKKAALR